MGQTWVDDVFAPGHVGQTDLQNIETNFQTLKSGFSGAAAPSSPVAGMGWFDTINDVMKRRNAANSAWGVDAFEPGVRMLFLQAAAPLGWTQIVTWNDRVLRIVSGVGGGSGGAWALTGLTVAAHGHGAGTYVVNRPQTSASPFQPGHSDAVPGVVAVTGTSATSAPNVSSDGAWRPSYLDAIVCSKD